MGCAMPERLVMTIHAGAIGSLDRLPAIRGVDAKLDQATHPYASAHDGMVAAGPVASFAPEAFEVVARLELEEPPHFGFREFAREIQMAGIAINAADVSGLGEIADVGIEVGRSPPSATRPASQGKHAIASRPIDFLPTRD